MPHADLSQLLDAVCRRAHRVEISTTLEHSIRASVSTDRLDNAESVHTRYAEHPSDALQLALVDAAQWINAKGHAQPRHSEFIRTDWAIPQVELAQALQLLVNEVLAGDATAASVTRARAALEKWGAS